MKFKRQTTRQANPNRPSKPAFSYYAANPEQTKDMIRQRQQTGQQRLWVSRLRMLPSLAAIMVIVGSVVYSTTLNTKAKIILAANNSPYRDVKEYEAYANDLLGKSLLNKSKLTINSHKLESEFIQHFPEAHLAKMSLPIIGRRPTLTLAVRHPMYLLSSSNRSLVIDTAGKAVMEPVSLNSQSLAELIKIQDNSGLDLKPGDQALSLQTVSFLSNFQKQLQAHKLSVSEITLPPKSNEADVRIKEVNYFIKTNLIGDPRVQAGTYMAVRDKLTSEKINPQEYVDVRVEEKVFYK